jgi:hypothetical protein
MIPITSADTMWNCGMTKKWLKFRWTPMAVSVAKTAVGENSLASYSAFVSVWSLP